MTYLCPLLVLLFCLSGCAAAATQPASTTGATSVAAVPTVARVATAVIDVTKAADGEINEQEMAQSVVVDAPAINEVTIDNGSTTEVASGTVPVKLDFTADDDNRVQEMQVCLSPEQTCPANTVWEPFAEERVFTVTVDWTGSKTLWLNAQFRDHNHQPVRAMGVDDDSPKSQVQYSFTLAALPPGATPAATRRPGTRQTATPVKKP